MITLLWEHPSYRANRHKGKFCGFKDEWVTSYPNPSVLKNGGETANTFEPRYTGSASIIATHTKTKRPKRIVTKSTQIDDLEFVNDNMDVNPLYAPIILQAQNDNTTFHTDLDESFVAEDLYEEAKTTDRKNYGGVLFVGPNLSALRSAAVTHFTDDALVAGTLTVQTSTGPITGVAIKTETIEDDDYQDGEQRGLDASIVSFLEDNPNATVALGRHQEGSILTQGGEAPRASKQPNLRNIPEFEENGFSFASEITYPNTATQLVPESTIGHAAFLLKIVVKFSKSHHNIEELTVDFHDFLDEILDGPKTTASSSVTLFPNGHDRVETFWFNGVLGNIKRPRFQFGITNIQHMPRLGMAIFGMQSGCDVRTGGGGIEKLAGDCDTACYGHTSGHVLNVQAFFTV